MKTRAAVTWREARGWLLALCLAQLAGACAQTSTNPGSGETHFVMCDEDSDCHNLGSVFSCVDGVCRTPLESPAVGGNGGSAGSPARLMCEGCAGMQCGLSGLCTREAACESIGCGGPTIDEGGCVRPGCVTDLDCADDARCTTVPWVAFFGDCEVTDKVPSGCACGTLAGIRDMDVCSPIALAGPRGTWQSISITEHGNPIASFSSQTRKVLPDGSLHKTTLKSVNDAPVVSEHQLTASELTELKRTIAGPRLRQMLANPDACGQGEWVDYSAQVELELDTGTWSLNVTNCTADPATWGRYPFRSLLDLVKKY